MGLAALLAAIAIAAPLLGTGRAAPTPLAPPPAQSPSPSPASPTPQPAPRPATAVKASSPKPDEWSDAVRIFDQLSPDQQKKFLDNLGQWKAMSPEEQALMREREVVRREKMAQEIQQAITKSGLRLDDDQREVYALRYTQERRKIEDALRKETDEKRQSMVSDMLDRLKVEFTVTPPPAPRTAGVK